MKNTLANKDSQHLRGGIEGFAATTTDGQNDFSKPPQFAGFPRVGNDEMCTKCEGSMACLFNSGSIGCNSWSVQGIALALL